MPPPRPASNAGRIRRRADDDEVVVHHVEARLAVALCDQTLLGLAVVDEQNVDVAVAGQAERPAGSGYDGAYGDPAVALELR